MTTDNTKEQVEGSKCEYTLLDGDIHQFTFKVGTKQAIDQWLAQSERLMQTKQPEDCLLYLIDTTEIDDLPISYAFSQIKEMGARYANPPRSRTAFVHKPSAMLFLVNAYIKLLRFGGRTESQFFTQDKRADAIRWLLDS